MNVVCHYAQLKYCDVVTRCNNIDGTPAEKRVQGFSEHLVSAFRAPLEVVYVVADAVAMTNKFWHLENLPEALRKRPTF